MKSVSEHSNPAAYPGIISIQLISPASEEKEIACSTVIPSNARGSIQLISPASEEL